MIRHPSPHSSRLRSTERKHDAITKPVLHRTGLVRLQNPLIKFQQEGKMKQISVIAFIALLLLAVSCDGSAPAPDTESGRLLLETNVRSIQKDSSTAAEARTVYEAGEPIIGVLLQTNTGSKDTFRLEYLGDGKVEKNGDGMEYNYILYQPEAIPDAYMEAGGNEIVATKTGSPF